MRGAAALFAFGAIFIAFGCAAPPASGSVPHGPGLHGEPQLVFVAIVSRHGVRSPLKPNDDIAKYTPETWPDWGVAPGELTPHGVQAATLMGRYYGRFYRNAGLLAAGCPVQDAYLYADSEQRTIATAQALADGINGDCAPAVNHLPENQRDPLIHPNGTPAPFVSADPQKSLAALQAAVPDPNSLLTTQAPAFSTLAYMLGCPERATNCTPVTSLPFSYKSDKGSGLAKLDGPLSAGQLLSEIFVLEYTNGMDTAWGRATIGRLLATMPLYVTSHAFEQRTTYLAQAQGSNIVWHLGQTLAQFADGKQRLDGAYAPPATSKFVMIVAHDSNLNAIGGILGLHWKFDSNYQPDETPPDGSLTFEVYQAPDSPPTIAIYFQAQTMDQMRNLAATPPLRVAVPIPGCASPCPLDTFQTLIKNAIDPHFVISGN